MGGGGAAGVGDTGSGDKGIRERGNGDRGSRDRGNGDGKARAGCIIDGQKLHFQSARCRSKRLPFDYTLER